jgi:hypothetical protein
MKGKRPIVCAAFTVLFTILIFCIRRGWERPFFALTDALFVGGFAGSALAIVPRAFALESFDGFAYALRFAAVGLFPSRMKSYSAFKKERLGKRTVGQERDFSWAVPAVCLALGSLFSLFFL